MKNRLKGINSRVTEEKEQINELETEWWKSLLQNRIKKKKNEDSLRELWDSIKYTNSCIIVAPEGKEIKSLRKYLKR